MKPSRPVSESMGARPARPAPRRSVGPTPHRSAGPTARRSAGPARRRSARAPLLTRAEAERAVLELASKLAPADVVHLLGQEKILHERAASLEGAPGEILRAELALALACLRDHARGACPQIPYRSVSLLAAGLAYLADQLDLVPDFLPRRGALDDALVMALACTLAADGLERYCTWKGIAPGLALPRARKRSRRSPVAGRRSSRRAR